jgi:threonine/homoserine/homoserine lactone efflux protein
LGTLFLFYLAYKISFSSSSKEDKKINPVNFFDTFIFQFLNPKGVMAAITLISKFVIEDDYLNSSLTVIAVCSLTALTSITTWAFFGKFLRNFATNNNFIKRFNYAMSLLLIVCIIGFYI